MQTFQVMKNDALVFKLQALNKTDAWFIAAEEILNIKNMKDCVTKFGAKMYLYIKDKLGKQGYYID